MSTSTPATMSPALQQAFLNCSHYFVTEGGSSTMSPMLTYCFSKAWLNSARACNPASPPTSLYLSTQGWPSPNLRPTWCRWSTLIWILESSIYFGPWANLGVLGNREQLRFNKFSAMLWYFLMEHWRCRILNFFPELEISLNVAPFAQLFDLVRGDQSGIFSDPAPCFISREDETNLTPEEKVLSIHYHKQWPILNYNYIGKTRAPSATWPPDVLPLQHVTSTV